MNSYKILNKQVFSSGNYSLVPIRIEDRFDIMKWRNEQIYHLRQAEPLTEGAQNHYFENIVSKLFEQEKPAQLLFSYLENGKCIGYGGLVHINWIDKNAEISFIMETSLEKNEFHKHWGVFLDLLEQIAFDELKLHKIYTYAFDLRPHLYEAIEAKGFLKEAMLKEHCFFEGKYIDVIIHSKIIAKYYLRLAEIEDVRQYYEWANDKEVRKNAFNTNFIEWENHINWFTSKLDDNNTRLFVMCNAQNIPVGQVRIDKNDNNWIIDYSIDKDYRKQGLGTEIIRLLIKENINLRLIAHVKTDNVSSCRVFKNNNFVINSKTKNNNYEVLTFQYN